MTNKEYIAVELSGIAETILLNCRTFIFKIPIQLNVDFIYSIKIIQNQGNYLEAVNLFFGMNAQ